MINILKRKILNPKLNNLIKKFSPQFHKERIISKEFYSQFVKPGDLCFDVGANLGNRTAIFLELGANVIAIEPQNSCYNYLKRLFADKENVTIIPKALGEIESTGQISICDEASVISTMSEKWMKEGRFSKDYHWNTYQKVEVTTLDKLIERYGIPDFCKIDVEGFEKSVIKGLSYKIKYLSIEFTKELFSESIECLNILESIGDLDVNYSLGESMILTSNLWLKKDELIKKIKDEKNNNLWGDIYIRLK